MALFKNKETDKKRKGENVIGKIIYGFLLFAPLMSILFTSLYTVFNKNAYESYSQQEVITNYKYQTNEVSVSNDLVIGRIYHCSIPLETFNTWTNDEFFRNSDFIYIETYEYGTIYYNMFENHLSKSGENSVSYRATVYDPNQTARNMFSYGFNPSYYGTNLDFDFIYTSNSVTYTTNLINYISASNYNEIVSYEINKTGYLDNAFEYGMYKTEQSNIYNWSKTTGTYTVLQNVCTGIGITNTFVPMLMAYWLLISIIYFLFDIALILIWAVHDKIHTLKDAI